MQHLIIWETANNFQGDMDHGKELIKAYSDLSKEYNLNAAIKFQYRDIPTFIAPNADPDFPHVQRFKETALSDDQKIELKEYVRTQGLKVIATPFDEKSVDLCKDLDYIKVASCSMLDWPLLEKVSELNKPVIVSTGGQDIADIDKVVSFFQHKGIKIHLLHCVALYPTPFENTSLNRIDELKRRYPGLIIGYSGHEYPDNNIIGMIAMSKGCQIFERHIGLKDLNKYSMNLDQSRAWVLSLINSDLSNKIDLDMSKQAESLNNLKRGVYSISDIHVGDTITPDKVYFAFPRINGQLTSEEFGSYRTEIKATRGYTKDDLIIERSSQDSDINKIRTICHRVKGFLNEHNINIGHNPDIELSHHYGLDKFYEYGAALVSLINREYCKKIIVQLPGQVHPEHYHKAKDETFHILAGSMGLLIEGDLKQYNKGDIVTVERYRKHAFQTQTGCIFEEISTTAVSGDSEYTEIEIRKKDPLEKKTKVEKL